MCEVTVYLAQQRETVSESPLAASRVISEAFSDFMLALKSVDRRLLWIPGLNWTFDFTQASSPS